MGKAVKKYEEPAQSPTIHRWQSWNNTGPPVPSLVFSLSPNTALLIRREEELIGSERQRTQ